MREVGAETPCIETSLGPNGHPTGMRACATVVQREFLHLASVSAQSGAGAFACQPCTRPRPIAWLRRQPRAHRVVLDIASDAIQFYLIPHTVIERFILPERLPRQAQDQVGLSCRGSFQPAGNLRKRCAGTQQDMHVIGHDYPRLDLIELPSAFAVEKGIGHHLSNAGIPQPNWAQDGFVRLPVESEECTAVGNWRGAGRLGRFTLRHRTSQTPSDEKKGCLSDFGMPVGKFAAVEHRGLAGESACPTFSYSACTAGNSRENVGLHA